MQGVKKSVWEIESEKTPEVSSGSSSESEEQPNVPNEQQKHHHHHHHHKRLPLEWPKATLNPAEYEQRLLEQLNTDEE